ncbi:MAG TPA: hypothetical protein VMU67_04995 [Steroidobacteraceae bacterium]|nr:hypothetical protein [Steroidobacteraceae bacterium]
MAVEPTAGAGVRSPGPPDHVTPYDRFAWTDEEVERLLVSGAQRAELEAFFGPAEYRVLVRLARAAGGARRAPDALRTIIVPGIMGSQLGFPRHAPLPYDILWLDPLDIVQGRLTELVVAGALRPTPCGVVLYSYLRLKLHLRAAGLDAVFHHYDWRLGVDALGAALAQRIAAEPSERLAVVGHSLGGLLGRAALALRGGGKVVRLVLLGTPNSGSYAAVQALRGTAEVVHRIARLDARHTAAGLAAAVFRTFPSLYHLLPRAGLSGTLDLLDPDVWPTGGPLPDPLLLRAARDLPDRLAPADERCVCVVGTGFPTVTCATRRRDQFLYTITRHGDGTVPIASAELAGARSYYAPVLHGELPRDPGVAAAIVELLSKGATRRLPSRRRSASRATARIGDHALDRREAGKIDWPRLTADERRDFLQNLNQPLTLALRVPRRRARAG